MWFNGFKLLVLYPWMTGIMISRLLGNSKIHSVTEIRDHQFMTSLKKTINIFTSTPTVCKNEQYFNCSKTIESANIWQILRIYPPPILWSSQMYYPLLRWLFSQNSFWQITSYTFWNLLQTGTDWKVKQDISETYNHIRSNNSSSKWLLKSDIT